MSLTDEDSREQLAAAVKRAGVTVGVAESLTGGMLTSAISAMPQASEWLKGGVVAYSSDVKFDVLGVTRGRVVTERCARELAEGACRLLGASVGVGVTGVGGPDAEEGQPPGSVFVAVHTRRGAIIRHWVFDGGPEAVLEETVRSTLHVLAVEIAALDPDRDY